MEKDALNILIIKPSSLGDIVLALPALSALRKSFPQSKISWLVRPEFAGLLEGHPHLDEIILFDRKYIGKAWRNAKAFGALLSLIKKLRRSRFDVVVDFQGLFRTAILAWLSGCGRRVGMANAREFANVFYTMKIKQTKETIHLVDYYLDMIKATGGMDVEAEFILPEDESADKYVSELLAGEKVGDGGYAVFVVGSAHVEKCWPVERFGRLADEMAARYGMAIVAAGSAGEKKKVEELQEKTKASIVNLAGRTSVKQMVSLLRKARIVVSNDTGPGHIAAALGVPLVMIFGRANPIRLAPYRRKECVAAIEPWERGFEINNWEAKYDISNVTLDEVYAKACAQLDRNQTGV